MLMRLWRGVAPGGRVSAESRRGKKRVTRMVCIVVVIFAVCWCPIQLVLVLKSLSLFEITHFTVMIQITSHVLAYTNSCINPILYAFLSDNFRKAFRKIVYCRAIANFAAEQQGNQRNQQHPNTNGNGEKSDIRQPLFTGNTGVTGASAPPIGAVPTTTTTTAVAAATAGTSGEQQQPIHMKTTIVHAANNARYRASDETVEIL